MDSKFGGQVVVCRQVKLKMAENSFECRPWIAASFRICILVKELKIVNNLTLIKKI